ncbi:MAG: NAD(P)H-dependent oxidoreductase [bacterium]|nr:NAD(P)H-dependent oxidoreductase [bacterium]
MRILAFAASLRAASLNKKLIALATSIAREGGVEVDLADFSEFDMPLYNGEVEKESGVPAGCTALVQRLVDADALMLATPEYNFGYPGTLKNALDWVSRVRPMPLKGHICYLLSASPSMIGGLRGLWQLRQPIEGLGTFVMPFMFSLPQADKAFGEDSQLVDSTRSDTLNTQVQQFLETTAKLRREVASGADATS